jgi:hypothetical protein
MLGIMTIMIKLINNTVVQIFPDRRAPFSIFPFRRLIPPAISWKLSFTINIPTRYHRTGYFAAISKVMMFKMVVDGKEEGKLVL